MSLNFYNPYAGVDWPNVPVVCTTTHAHCTAQKTLNYMLQEGLDLALLSNYYPSAPYYPLRAMRENCFKVAQPGGVIDGVFRSDLINFNQIIASYQAELPEERRQELPFQPGDRLFPDVPAELLEAPNAEHHSFADCTIYLHVTAPGCALASGNFDLKNKFALQSHGCLRGFPLPWREAFKKLFASLIYPEGGGIIINHPTWSHLPLEFMLELLDFDSRVLGIEIYNHSCKDWFAAVSTTEWDSILKNGRRCWGFCVPDHTVKADDWQGKIFLLPEKRTARSCLQAMREGKFYGAIYGRDLRFEHISFADGTLRARCNRQVSFQLCSRQGVVEDFDGQELVWHLPPGSELRHGFLRLTALDMGRDQLFAQPIML